MKSRLSWPARDDLVVLLRVCVRVSLCTCFITPVYISGSCVYSAYVCVWVPTGHETQRVVVWH